MNLQQLLFTAARCDSLPAYQGCAMYKIVVKVQSIWIPRNYYCNNVNIFHLKKYSYEIFLRDLYLTHSLIIINQLILRQGCAMQLNSCQLEVHLEANK